LPVINKYFSKMDLKQLFLSWLGEGIGNWDIQYRIHATQRMFQRNFDEKDVLACLGGGIIIEYYEFDFPFPSFLINCKSSSNNPMHLVIGVDKKSKRLYVITVYEPEKTKWSDDFSRRI
jgi:hypothetical protein